jgi:hypothetical protein
MDQPGPRTAISTASKANQSAAAFEVHAAAGCGDHGRSGVTVLEAVVVAEGGLLRCLHLLLDDVDEDGPFVIR